MLNVVMLNVVMLNVVMQSVVMLNVVAPSAMIRSISIQFKDTQNNNKKVTLLMGITLSTVMLDSVKLIVAILCVFLS